jgi:hypothetical protein
MKLKHQSFYAHLSLFISVISVAFLSQSCSNGTVTTGPESGIVIDPITIALPYVEAVNFPAEIHAGQAFDIQFQVSCVQNPDSLRIPARPFSGSDLRYTMHSVGDIVVNDYSIACILYRDLAQVAISSPIVSSVSFNVKGLSAGQHRLHFMSASTHDEGGRELIVNKRDWTWVGVEMSAPYIHNQEFTVLP